MEFVQRFLNLAEDMAEHEEVVDRMAQLQDRFEHIREGPLSQEVLDELQAIHDEMERGLEMTREHGQRMTEFVAWMEGVADADPERGKLKP